MKGPLIMTPGPTYVDEEVRAALAKPITNPDIDSDFYEYYQNTCSKLQKLMNTENQVLILSGEGILGLEAACASLIEPGDKVLCIDNGIFGNGFGDFAKIYGAEVSYFKADYRKAINLQELEEFLENNHDFKVATLVHCETPSGITNPVDKLCLLLKKHRIITVVDSVSAIGGERLETDKWGMDIVLGGSQKCLSAPPGLTFLSISQAAWEVILNRKAPIASFYCNLANWKDWYEKQWFPYTQPISDIYGLRVAVERWLEENNPIDRHAKLANAVRESLVSGGLELYPLDGFSNTVTTINIPKGVSYQDIYDQMLKDHNIMITGAFGFLKDKVIRIGHMGENCHEEKLYLTLKALDLTLRSLGVELKGELDKLFISAIKG
ncbi:aspartate aminotransferase-like enzyme [Orenia metallireducens]|uniref:Aspartate aminotransferase n=1 Tax=Orenia metallireducens TaxID=1413210 RepID=A0A285GS88_9FIRM|nr:alanine--glyoxylate aminotransferase family protein [Orenia metallireducens]PRX32621.1 aspartate aminotransferase-like enzyme [Orenia metallireducens]SNY26520.1 aspartate aminotransferase [Orenia metallireducens]